MPTTYRRSRRCRWFSDRFWNDYSLETRILGLRVELHAVHLKTGHLFVVRAERIEAAAAALASLVENYWLHEALASIDDETSELSSIWRKAAELFQRLVARA